MFEDFTVNTRLKLTALWTSVMFCYLYGDYFELYVPQKLEGMINGNNLLDSPIKLLVAACLLTIPALMIVATLWLKPRLTRILNMVWGIFFTTVMVMIAFTSLSPWRSFYVFLALVESCITAVIVWQAWKWPKTTT
ncbi:MAG: hypothetical protein KDC57_23425 [Saprospiraceae bacterium]|nr:hypothetical protein [Saprospiraceae bacterium]